MDKISNRNMFIKNKRIIFGEMETLKKKKIAKNSKIADDLGRSRKYTNRPVQLKIIKISKF